MLPGKMETDTPLAAIRWRGQTVHMLAAALMAAAIQFDAIKAYPVNINSLD